MAVCSSDVAICSPKLTNDGQTLGRQMMDRPCDVRQDFIWIFGENTSLSRFLKNPQNCDIRTRNLADLIGIGLQLRYSKIRILILCTTSITKNP